MGEVRFCIHGCLCVSSHYLILPRVRSSLVVLYLGVSVPIPKAQGMTSGQEQRFHKFVMALNGLKQIHKSK